MGIYLDCLHSVYLLAVIQAYLIPIYQVGSECMAAKTAPLDLQCNHLNKQHACKPKTPCQMNPSRSKR